LRKCGPPLGIIEDVRYVPRAIVLSPGDLLLLYTDGVTEAENAQSAQFGMQSFRTGDSGDPRTACARRGGARHQTRRGLRQGGTAVRQHHLRRGRLERTLIRLR
jgi:hypothetical protein